MSAPLLIDVPKDSPSLRCKLSAFKKLHGIKTHRTSGMARRDHPWLAVLPFDYDKGKSFFDMMAESCRLYEESGHLATGTGELMAIRKLCVQRGIACDL